MYSVRARCIDIYFVAIKRVGQASYHAAIASNGQPLPCAVPYFSLTISLGGDERYCDRRVFAAVEHTVVERLFADCLTLPLLARVGLAMGPRT